jgi:hypothetical protein
MSAQRRSNLSPAAGSKPDTVEEAWCRHYKSSAAGSRRAACKYVGSEWMPPSLRDFAEGDRYHKIDPSSSTTRHCRSHDPVGSHNFVYPLSTINVKNYL